jgi:hypothetical protein
LHRFRFIFACDIAAPQALHLGIGRQQLRKRSLRRDTAILHHNDPVGTLQRGPPVRHNH